MKYFCVMEYASKRRVYLGRYLVMAAYRLEPGTVYGSGPTKEAADEQAKQRAHEARRR